MERTQFTFYESFFRAISRIKKAADRAAAYDAICAYALYGTEPDMDALPDAAAIAFELSRPNLDASKRKAENGKKGGESKQVESKAEANQKQTEAKLKQTASKKEKEREKEKEIENECYITPNPPNGRFVPPTVEEVAQYCRQRGSSVDPQQFVDHYTANGWKVGGRGAMKDWQAAVRTWEKNGFREPKKTPNNMVGADFSASNERIRKQSDWLDEFLAGQEEGA